MQITAMQYGRMMRTQGVLWPAPVIDSRDLAQPGVIVHQIGRRSPEKVFVLERRGWGTVYVSPSYSDYRAAFDQVMPRTSTGRDVDHLFPKSQARQDQFIALGRIGITSNRGWNAEDTDQAMAQKVRNMLRESPHSFTSRLTDMERGWAVVTCYIRPMRELDHAVLKPL